MIFNTIEKKIITKEIFVVDNEFLEQFVVFLNKKYGKLNYVMRTICNNKNNKEIEITTAYFEQLA